MNITVNRGELAAAFRWAAGALPRRPAVPVLAGMMLDVEDRTLTFTAFDYEQARRGRCAGTQADSAAGRVLVDGQALKKLISALPKPARARPADVLLTAGAGTLTVTCQEVTATLPALPDGEYPATPAMPPAAGVIDGTQFARAVTRVAAAASRDDTLPALCTVQFTTRSAALGLAATDRYRLAHDRLFWTPADPEAPSTQFLVPAQAVTEFAAKAGKHGKVTVHLGETTPGHPAWLAGFRDDARELTIRTTDEQGQFPRWQQMFRASSPVNLVVDPAALTGALKQMNALTGRHGVVRLRYADGTLTVHALDEDTLASCAAAPVPAEADIPEFTVWFCAPYLWPALEGIDGKAVIGLAGSKDGKLSGSPEDVAANPKIATVSAADGSTFTAIVVPTRGSQ